MMHSNGISYEGDILDLGNAHKIINRGAVLGSSTVKRIWAKEKKRLETFD